MPTFWAAPERPEPARIPSGCGAEPAGGRRDAGDDEREPAASRRPLAGRRRGMAAARRGRAARGRRSRLRRVTGDRSRAAGPPAPGPSGRRGGRARDRPAAGPGGAGPGPAGPVVRTGRVRGAAGRRPAAGRGARLQRVAPVRRGRGGRGLDHGPQPAGREWPPRRRHLRRDRPARDVGRRRPIRATEPDHLDASRRSGPAVDRRRAATQGPHPPERAREAVHAYLEALDGAWDRAAPQASYGVRQRWVSACAGLREQGWPVLDGPRRWRLGELSVAWEAVAQGAAQRA